ncbi:MAG: hypothetical protein HW396_169 [Candidatus Dadabacteria bacterium]|nr:hypothetical protein [Candidatus Dadabacteria bacterium]
MNKAKWVLFFLLAVLVAVPSYAVELTLGGFPSYFRIRPQFYKDSTFVSALSNAQARTLGFNDADDNIVFVDSRLRLTPQLVLSDAVTIRAQVDVMDNTIWGGTNNVLVRDVVYESLTPTDRFRGALLVGPVNGNVLFNGLFGAGNGVDSSPAVDDVQYFNVRMLHVDIVLPHNLGFIRAGRQPFDWGLGILANGGWDPLSDLGFVIDRFLYLKSWPLMNGTFTFVFVSDRLRQGTNLYGGLETGSGDGYDGGAFALIYNQGPLTVGGYLFPYIHQTNFAGTDANLNRFTLWALLADFKTDYFRFVGEMQQAQGNITGAQSLGFANDEINIDASNLIFAVRGEVYPGFPVKIGAVEFGYANGDNIDPANDGGDFQGNVVAFSAAYNIDNLLFKHIIPNIYGLENSVINAFYVRGWMTAKLMDHVTFTPQVLVAWNEETQALVQPTFFAGNNGEVDRFLGAELEGTLSIEVVTGVNFDFIGSVVVSGSGLKDLYEQRAAIEVDPTGATSPGTFDAPSAPFAFQGRLLVYIDQFFK